MPCYDGQNHDSGMGYLNTQIAAKNIRIQELNDRLDAATKCSCAVLRMLEDKHRRTKTPDGSYTLYEEALKNSEIAEWWEEHKQIDTQREQYHYERLLSSLSEEDIEILNKFGLPKVK